MKVGQYVHGYEGNGLEKKKMDEISSSPVTYFGTNNIKLQIPLPECPWHEYSP
jgi:hypothetical protein